MLEGTKVCRQRANAGQKRPVRKTSATAYDAVSPDELGAARINGDHIVEAHHLDCRSEDDARAGPSKSLSTMPP